jgi:hypothetical protein
LKVFLNKKFCRGTLLIGAAFSVYLWAIHGWMELSIAIFLVCLAVVAYIRNIKFHIEEEYLVVSQGEKILSKLELRLCYFYTLCHVSFMQVVYKGRWLWVINLVDEKRVLFNEIFSGKSEKINQAERNSSIFIRRTGFILSSIIGLGLIFTPLIEYVQIPKVETELFEVKGSLSSIDLKKALKLKLNEYEHIFMISPKMGDIKDYESKLKNLIGEDVSLFISKSEDGFESEQINVWAINNRKHHVIRLDDVTSAWFDWKRLVILLIFGIILLFYSTKKFIELGDFDR